MANHVDGATCPFTQIYREKNACAYAFHSSQFKIFKSNMKYSNGIHNLNVRMDFIRNETEMVKKSSLAGRLKHVSFLSKFPNNNIYIMKILVTLQSNHSCNRN